MIFSKKQIDGIKVTLPRDELLRRSRILVVDDERPEIIEDLKSARFSVDYCADIDRSNLDLIERRLYDLILLDFGNVGAAFGNDQGLSLLRHIKRVNPATVVLAYTSKALGTEHAEFFRLADGVLAKDAGISESLERIEEALRKAHSVENLWRSVLAVCDIRPGSDSDREWQDLFVRGLKSPRKLARLKERIADVVGQELMQKVAIGLVEKMAELVVRSYLGV